MIVQIQTAVLGAVWQFLISLLYLFYEEGERRQARERKTMLFVQNLQMRAALYYRGKISKRPRHRSCWMKKRSDDWWTRIVKKHFTEDDWLENFRVTPDTFHFICERLRPYLQPKEKYVRTSATVEKKVAITLYKLASCAEYRIVANQFGIHKSSVHVYVYDVINAIYAEFGTEYLSMPNELEAEEVSQGFESMCGLPNVIGAIDGTHIPILPPKDGYRDFINRKGWPSYNVLAVVDNSYRFRYVTCKHPGCTHDAKVLKDSSLYNTAKEFIPNRTKTIDDKQIPLYLLGDPAYPLLPWLMKGYKGQRTPEEESFNVYLSQGRVVVENAFGRLKARFRCLTKRVDISYKFVPKVIGACMILNNIIECRKEKFVQSWLTAVAEAEIAFPQPRGQSTRDFDSLEAGIIRDTLKTYMTRYPLRSSRL
ncbi:unnamed protein product [Callosobruchus maculatus]|uniref:Uncharacterized protein n=1 Tax=Callosobruchus maculatus TaxID=64391 RepID=A0A653CNK0_CALMS|nr:unnamed protein product [Callosobruchus maculatus]